MVYELSFNKGNKQKAKTSFEGGKVSTVTFSKLFLNQINKETLGLNLLT